MRTIAILNIFLLLLFFGLTINAFTPAFINAPAVILQNNSGILTTFKLNVTKGNGNVLVIGVPSVANSTIDSAYTAVEYASNYTLLNESNYNFTYTILDHNTSVSGSSAGAAMTILAISVLSNKTLTSNFTMTGTISLKGIIGPIGGVYDKALAAHNQHMNFILVPKVPKNSNENKLYFLIQTAFNIPLIQVINISEASIYAFSKSSNTLLLANKTNYNFYTDYNISSLNISNINCINNCNTTLYKQFINFTFNLTQNEIIELNHLNNFHNISQQLNKVLNQSKQISSKGYLYTGADFAFIDYLNAFYFTHAYITKKSGLNILKSIQNNCKFAIAPKLTFNNYDFVLNGELRQLWGQYSIKQEIKNYNLTSIDTDYILNSLYNGAEANAWCAAANFIYSKQNNTNNSFVSISNLSHIANQSILNASSYPGMYLTTAQQAYNSKNYALAILDAGYAYAIGISINKFDLNASSLNNITISMLNRSFSGSFATNFANQAQFYLQESKLTENASLIHQYSYQAYSSVLIANQISKDMNLISQNMHINQTAIIQTKFFNKVSKILNEIAILLFILIFLIIISVIILLLILLRLNKQNNNLSVKQKNIKHTKKIHKK